MLELIFRHSVQRIVGCHLRTACGWLQTNRWRVRPVTRRARRARAAQIQSLAELRIRTRCLPTASHQHELTASGGPSMNWSSWTPARKCRKCSLDDVVASICLKCQTMTTARAGAESNDDNRQQHNTVMSFSIFRRAVSVEHPGL
jgi:hypothetical protein